MRQAKWQSILCNDIKEENNKGLFDLHLTDLAPLGSWDQIPKKLEKIEKLTDDENDTL